MTKEVCPGPFPGTEVDWDRITVSIELSYPSKYSGHMQLVYQEGRLAHLDSKIIPEIVRRVTVARGCSNNVAMGKIMYQ